MRYEEKYFREGYLKCMLDTQGYNYTHWGSYNTYCFSTATMVAVLLNTRIACRVKLATLRFQILPESKNLRGWRWKRTRKEGETWEGRWRRMKTMLRIIRRKLLVDRSVCCSETKAINFSVVLTVGRSLDEEVKVAQVCLVYRPKYTADLSIKRYLDVAYFMPPEPITLTSINY